MLVLSRLRDETIMIGDEIEITIVDIRGDKVRLGITAPVRVAVHRKEVYDAIKAENHRAAQAAGAALFPSRTALANGTTGRARAVGRAASLATGTGGIGAVAPVGGGPIPISGSARTTVGTKAVAVGGSASSGAGVIETGTASRLRFDPPR